jgi:hypothetical protein
MPVFKFVWNVVSILSIIHVACVALVGLYWLGNDILEIAVARLKK